MLDTMDWKKYEHEIAEQFRAYYPSARITHNATLIGKFSKIERQIDILVEEQPSDLTYRIVVDAKYRGRKIDVGDVEGFLGFVRDTGATTGVMVALEGYTPAAMDRAHNDDLDIILDVLNLDELKSFQGETAIPYSGEHGASVAAPFGWIVDATKRQNALAWLYQRGLSFEEAVGIREFMYINFWSKKKEQVTTLDDLVVYQETYIKQYLPGAEIQYLENPSNHRAGKRTLIRIVRHPKYPTPEYTGFIDFDEFVLLCVLFSPEQLERKNLRKLRYILRDAFPMQVQQQAQ